MSNFNDFQKMIKDLNDENLSELCEEFLTNQQLAYVVKNSIGVACSSGLVSHMASEYGIKTVSLHSKYFIKNTKPFWTEENICLEPTRDIKPTFSNKDPKHRIKSIKPEIEISSRVENYVGYYTF